MSNSLRWQKGKHNERMVQDGAQKKMRTALASLSGANKSK